DQAGVAWLKIDKADGGANVLSGAVLTELNELLEMLESDPPRGVVLYSGKSSGFVMGADINEFTTIENTEQAFTLIRLGQAVMDRLEALPCPTVAVINGFALGGGLELAMACDYRIALESDKRVLGLPEVQLGLHPGFGGTVRAVRIAGVRPAMQLMLTGKSIRVSKGRAIGLIDRIVAEDSWREAATDVLAATPPKRQAPFVERLLSSAALRPFIRNVLLKQVARKARKDHYPAPYAIVDLWSRFGAKGEVAFVAEARSMAELFCTETSRNLVRVFFLQNKLKGQGDKSAPKIEHVHVVGAGVMGGDIAAWCALRGMDVTLQDRELKYIEPALERAEKLFSKRIRDDQEREDATARLRADVEGDGAASADLVIEAIFENLEAKQSLYRELQAKMKPGALLATNTSSIPLEELRTVLDDPERFIGLHFFNPVAQMMIVEVIRCEDTASAALDIGFGFVKRIGKLPLQCNSAPGFVVNRILAPYMGEAMALAEEGVALAAIDEAAVAFGMPMGPVELVDSVGLDVALHVSKVLGSSMNSTGLERLARMVEAGDLGRKSGRGFYEWVEGKAVKPATTGDVPMDMQDRLILAMVNEAVACLADGVVSDADLLDAGVIFGTGFAPFRGGPLQYARSRGVDSLTARLEELAAMHGDRFEPHQAWSTL
ncbi:MAG: 3-hydroxyacyl-CoA dehydrogenase NAD-binding domain-containing protein, partial [Proteobacteria bacterium]|nr:3-hydroxyacyl-CoA dehydrogenase NAD-binding domain-containing protein [Pseudomonadota bacterium]